jgi:hypothetical protein
VNNPPSQRVSKRWLGGMFATRFYGKLQLSHFARSRILILLTAQHFVSFWLKMI